MRPPNLPLRLAPLTLTLVLALLAACGSGGGASDPPPSPSVRVTASASSTIAGGTAITLTAALSGGATGPVVWSLTSDGDGDPGTVSSTSATTATYGPPAATPATFHVTVRATARDNVTASTVITVALPGTVPSITVTASSASAQAGGASVQVTAALGGGASGPLTWTVSGDGAGSAGTVASTGATTASYTPPASAAATFHATITATGAAAVSGSAIVTVAPASTLSVKPQSAGMGTDLSREVPAGDAPLSFRATRSGGGSFAGAVWTVESAAADPGRIEDSFEDWGSYVPPAVLTTTIDVTVKVTLGSESASAIVRVHPVVGGARVGIAPGAQTAAAGGAAIQLAATLVGGAQGPVTWSLASGSPGTLAPEGVGSTARYTPPATVDAPTTVTIIATPASGAAATATVNVVAAAGTVNGKIFSRDTRLPLAGATVQIGAATAQTAEDGTFAISGVRAPYTLAVVSTPPPLDGPPSAEVFEDVTTFSPEAYLDALPTAGPSYVTVSGTVTNRPGPSNMQGEVAGVGVWRVPLSVEYSVNDFQVRIPVLPPASATLRLYESSGRYGSQTVAIPSTDAVSAVTIALGDPAPLGTVSGTIAAASGLSYASSYVVAEFAPRGLEPFLIPWHTIDLGSFSARIPHLPGATETWFGTLDIGWNHYGEVRAKVSLDHSGLALVPPLPPSLAAPVYGAAVPADGVLTWSGAAPAEIVITCERDYQSIARFRLHVAGTSVRIPALQALPPLAPGDVCTWHVLLSDDGRPVGALVDGAAAGPVTFRRSEARARRFTIQ